jgi:glycosyltransferase involved in cell wall biosynthesis
MKAVGVDGMNLALAQGTGVATYARELTRAHRALGLSVDVLYGLRVPAASRPELRETLFYSELGRDGNDGRRSGEWWTRAADDLPTPGARTAVEVPVAGRVVSAGLAERMPAFDRLFTYGGLFSLADRYFRRHRRFLPIRVPTPPDVMHWTYPLPIRMVGSRNVYTIHDLVPIRLPFTSLEDKRGHDRLLRACFAQAAAVCTVSDASRKDMLDLYGADPERVVNTYQSVALPRDLIEMPRAALGAQLSGLFDLSDQGYFLYFGAIEPKKNVARLIEAYLTLPTRTPLVLVSAPGWSSGAQLRLLDDGAGGRVRRLGYLPRELLLQLVRGARAVVFPSLYEGFGLPVLEAMALGAPVLTSTAASLPELAGEAALLADPYDVAAIREGLARLDGDPELRRRLADAGPRRAQLFSAERYQARLRRLYDVALGAS